MSLAHLPGLDVRVVVTAKDHPLLGRAGTVVDYHIRLPDNCYVRFDGDTAATLIECAYLDLDLGRAA